MSIKSFFKDMGDKIALLFGHMPKDWVEHTDEVVRFFNKAKTFLSAPTTLILASLIPNGWGNIAREDLLKIITETLPTLEIAQQVEHSLVGVTDVEQQANIIMQTILANMAKLPADWQGKHWLDMARKLLTTMTGMTNTEANALINMKYGQIQSS